MTNNIRTVADWLDERTHWRAIAAWWNKGRSSDARWAYTLGASLLVLLVVLFVTGGTLMLYYVPTPTHAYDSVRYVVSDVPFGGLVRGMHYYGASLIIAVAALHLLRTLIAGSYKGPREGTWLSGVVLLALLVGFGLTGYLLPWDQMGYWASVVRTNFAGMVPVIGPWVGRLVKGGPSVGAMTLSRWYMLHVIVLPLGLALFTIGHLVLVRMHGRAAATAPRPDDPSLLSSQLVRNMIVGSGLVLGVLYLAVKVQAPLESMADPSDFTFVPRPEWYFLWLFQLMRLGSAWVEKLGAPMVLMGIMTFLAILPFVDRQRFGRPRSRAWIHATAAFGVLFIGVLTWMAYRADSGAGRPAAWGPVAIAGQQIASREGCTKCHGPSGVAPDLHRGRVSHDNAWIRNHLTDPDAMAPGLKPTPFDAPTRPEILAVVAYQAKMRAGVPEPKVDEHERKFSLLYTTACASCHTIDGEGIADGPDLSHAGKAHDARWLAEKIVDPAASDKNSKMPSLEDKMADPDVQLLAQALARRK